MCDSGLRERVFVEDQVSRKVHFKSDTLALLDTDKVANFVFIFSYKVVTWVQRREVRLFVG